MPSSNRRARTAPSTFGGRPPRKRRGRPRRTPILFVVLLAAALAALAVVVASGPGAHTRTPASHAGTRAPSSASSATLLASLQKLARSGHAGLRESSEVRRLVALGHPIYCAPPHGDEVALTFDDGPGPYTRLVLAKLRKHGVHATFFAVGRNIDLVRGPEGASIVRREQAQGALGDHTFTHPLLTTLAPGRVEREIVRTQLALERASHTPVFLFRPPYGAHNRTVDRIVRAHGLLEIMWSVDSADSLGANYAQIERNVIAGMRPGAIILMHENHGQTVRALINIFAALKRKHLRAVSVAQLLTDDPPSRAQVLGEGSDCGLGARATLSGG